MKKFVLIVCFILIIVATIFFLNTSVITSDQILSQEPLSCREKNSSNIITANLNCSSNEDCIKWAHQNCGPENKCDNSRIVCKNNVCIEETYYKADVKCI